MTFSSSADGLRHVENVRSHYVGLDLQAFVSEAWSILNLSPLVVFQDDLYIHLLSYFVGGLLQWPDLFFPLVAFIYGFFYSGSIVNLLKLFDREKSKWTIVAGTFFFLFFFFKSLEGINTVRTWTGLWCILYGLTSYLIHRDKRYLVYVFLSPFIHIGYFVMALPIMLFLFFGIRPVVFAVIFILSFIVKPTFQQVNTAFSVGEIGKDKVESYHDELNQTVEKIESEYSNHTFYSKYMRLALHDTFVSIFAILFILNGAYFRRFNYQESFLFSAGILTLSLAHFVSFISAVSNRSIILGVTLVMASFFLYFGRLSSIGVSIRKTNTSAFILFLCLIPFCLYKISDIFYFASVFLLAFPITPLVADNMNISVQDFLKSILF